MSVNNFMNIAIDMANTANDLGEVPIGCVIINGNNEILAKCYNTVILDSDPTAHAEINAIREACQKINSDRLINCSIYITLEPCIMCASAISKAKIKRLYYGADDLNFGSVNGKFNFFQSDNCNYIPEIYDNIAKSECENIINNFFKDKR